MYYYRYMISCKKEKHYFFFVQIYPIIIKKFLNSLIKKKKNQSMNCFDYNIIKYLVFF